MAGYNLHTSLTAVQSTTHLMVHQVAALDSLMLTGHEQTCTEGGINVTGKNPRCQNLFPYFAVTRHKTGTYYPFEINHYGDNHV
jgi:hypothetical protein